MANNDLFTDFSQTQQRIRQQGLIPTAVKTRTIDSNFIQNTTVSTNGPFSLSSGSALVVQSIVSNIGNPSAKIAGVPFCISFFETSLSTSNIIGSGVLRTGYIFNGPFAMSNFTTHANNGTTPVTYGGSDGNNLVYVTTLINNTGLTKTIYYITNTRFIQAIGGGGSFQT